MRYMTKILARVGIIASIWIVTPSAAVTLTAEGARASNQPSAARIEGASSTGAKGKKAGYAPAGQYFIEFRARHALSYGHTFAMFGRLDRRGRILEREVAGLHPAGDSPVPWMIGHVVPVRSETGPSDGDLEEKYVSARYRVVLSAAEYTKVTAFIKKLQANSPLWSAVAYNCNAFVADIARYMGLETPSSTLLYPADFINKLRDLNARRERAAMAGTQPAP